MTPIDWERVYSEAERHLVALIRADTSNPPGDERPAVDYIAAVLRDAGVEPTVLGLAAERPNVVARLTGRGTDGPLLFLSHTDVVPAVADDWERPPFGGEIVDGVIWGRGTLDMKHIVAATLAVTTLVAESSALLDRDLIFAATADEESAGLSGAEWLFAEHRPLVECDLAVTEGGHVIDYLGQPYFVIEASQKGWMTLEIVRRSIPGHSSIPSRDNCLFTVGTILDRLGRMRFPHRVPLVSRAFIEGLAAYQRDAERTALLELLHEDTFERGLDALSCDPYTKAMFEAILHGHATPTVIHGGESMWSIPGEVRLSLAGRVLPGETEEVWVAGLESVIGSLGEHHRSPFDAGDEIGVDTPLFTALEASIKAEYPNARVLPGVLPGGGDLRHARAAGATAYGFFPLMLEDGKLMELAHGRNERISRANLRRCVRYAWDVLVAANPDLQPASGGELDRR